MKALLVDEKRHAREAEPLDQSSNLRSQRGGRNPRFVYLFKDLRLKDFLDFGAGARDEDVLQFDVMSGRNRDVQVRDDWLGGRVIRRTLRFQGSTIARDLDA